MLHRLGTRRRGGRFGRSDPRLTLLERTSEAVFVRWASDDTVIFWNAAATRLYGYTAEEALGRTPMRLLQTCWPEPLDSVRATLEREGYWEGEVRHRTADGREVTVLSRELLDPDSDDWRPVILDMSTDITARKRHELELAAAELRWRTAVENLPGVSLAIFDEELRHVEVGGDILRAVSMDRGQLIGRRLSETAMALDPPTRERILEACRAALSGRSSAIEVNVLGEWLDSRYVPLDLPGGVRYAMGMSINVTERHRQEQALRDTGVRWRAAVDNLPGGSLVIVDADLRIVEAGGEVLRDLQLPREQVIGRPIGFSLEPETAERMRRAYRDALDGHPCELEYQWHDRTVYARVVSFALADGSRYGMMLAFDVTERKGLEERLQQAAKMEAVGQLAGGIAHDFNNLLTVICGYCAVGRQTVGAGPGAGELEEIARAAERAKRLTGQLLAFSRRQILRPEPLDVAEVTRGLVPMLDRLIGDNITVCLDECPERLPAALADRGQLEQVIVNLAVNARDAMPAGGTLTITTAAAEDGSVRLDVTDNGAGMSPEVLQRAFEPFFTTKDPGQGTGLGLATVHGIVTQTGGQTTIRSQPGEGTTVSITLPATARRDGPAGQAADRCAASVHGDETILLCEDDEAVRALIELLLRQHGYTVISAASPTQALEAVAAHPGPIHAFVSDIVMPEMSGPALAERLREQRSGLRTVFVSGYSGHVLRGSEQIPADAAFVQKPFEAPDLLLAVRELLDNTRGSA